MNIEQVMEATGYTREQIKMEMSRALGKIETWWRCGATGLISEGPFDCSCDSILCDLGEEVTVTPA